MARKASRIDQLALARELLRTAKTADELRKAQAINLPISLKDGSDRSSGLGEHEKIISRHLSFP